MASSSTIPGKSRSSLPAWLAGLGKRTRLVWQARRARRDVIGGGPNADEIRRMLERAEAFGYFEWPFRLRKDVVGQDVLDVGCGSGLHGLGFIASGARSYTGVDPSVSPDEDRVRQKRKRKDGRIPFESFGWTPQQIEALLPQVRLVCGTDQTLPEETTFDRIVLHQVTEHIMDLDLALARFRRRLRPHGRLLYKHHSYTCWNGHHRKPKTIDEIDPDDPEQRHYLDWAHLDTRPPEEHSMGMNRVRLDEIRAMTERHFRVVTWREKESSERLGGKRLTADILARHPGYSRRELATQSVFCVAEPKA
ncbi:class I SAM-dependent methyltransferase [Marinivivus vitaminiproducens]|uniref:class I SAM-dependent methyltransferase n=1 Tax=Marinivivus vitaminiproducens TaxID=3035935 RepID=UPI0027A4C3EC|nr:class I SAM-dependent methyltransferase [Geminicoccaceae bacterium SCSIO 64248]